MTTETVKENRLWNFRQIIRSLGVNEVARLLGKKNSYITAIGGPNPTRAIGNKVAQQVETVFKLEPGSLDSAPPAETMNTDDYLARICSVLANANDGDKEFVLHVAAWIVGRTMKSKPILDGTVITPDDLKTP